jgi:hypothetical protein
LEVVDLRRKIEKSNVHSKFKNNSTILDEILDNQRPPNDKYGLGYNKEVEKYKIGTWTSIWKYDIGSSSSKGESEVVIQEPMQIKGNFRIL